MLRSAAILASAALAAAAADVHLANDQIVAAFDSRGLSSITDRQSHTTWHFSKDEFVLTLAGQAFDSARFPTPARKFAEATVVYTYLAGPYTFHVVYELRPKWRFISKLVTIVRAPPGRFRVDGVTVFRGGVEEPVQDAAVIDRARPNLGTSGYGAFLRVAKAGLLVTAQNPFLAFDRDGNDFSLGYQPAMDWDLSWGPFEADRGLLAPYELSGRRLPRNMLAEWRLGPVDQTPGLDESEVAAFTGLVRAFLLYQPVNPLNIMVGWCANDYQIDIATAEGRTEYKRILDMAAAVGAEHVLFAPANSEVSRRDNSRDDWKWEYVLWLGLGQKIRNNQWDPATGPIPASVREMLDYAHSKRLSLVAYVYPVMGFTQDLSWLLGGKGTRANLGVRTFQDWLTKALEDFYYHTGISGYSFDHTFLNYDGASKYAQWWGWRRVLETLRRDIPEIVIDGRQAYQNYGPWTWLAGSYPHPTSTDEQPESFTSFPDLKLDRVSADRQRYTAYRYRNYEFAPSEIVPGFITHQTPRNDDSGRMPVARTATDEVAVPFRRRDWDYLGWRYSLISSIATAGWNNVIDMIPARDPAEFEHFPPADRQWFLHWIDWADANKEYLRHTRTILGQPAIGKVDGTAAIVEDEGYVFLFNPNGRRLEARFTFDETIGLESKRNARFLLRELYPVEGRLIGKPGSGAWSWGDTVTLDMDGGSARALRIEPDDRDVDIRLFNVPGAATLEDGILRLAGVRGEVGTSENILVRVPASAKVTSVAIGEATFPARMVKPGLLEIPATFAGEPFRHYQQIDRYDAAFTGGAVKANFRIPKRIFDQLEARRKAWPIPWTEEDYRSTWLVPERLLLYVQLAEPDDRWTASLEIDGRPVQLEKAYASVRVSRHNFTGFYADVSKLAAATEHTLELELPSSLKPGQFQGVFFENVETEYTSEIVR
jgi:hypothetical protein